MMADVLYPPDLTRCSDVSEIDLTPRVMYLIQYFDTVTEMSKLRMFCAPITFLQYFENKEQGVFLSLDGSQIFKSRPCLTVAEDE